MRLCPQAELAALLQLAEDMFPEGHGAPRAARVFGAAAPFINALVVNSKAASDELWKLRGYDPKTPDITKARLGYRLDQYEAAAWVVEGRIIVHIFKGDHTGRSDRSVSKKGVTFFKRARRAPPFEGHTHRYIGVSAKGGGWCPGIVSRGFMRHLRFHASCRCLGGFAWLIQSP